MRIFVTGATGFIGSAIVTDLLARGHRVLGLARSDKSVDALTKVGAEAHRGTLDDADSLRRGAAACDGVIHTAFIHDFADYAGAGETDRQAVEALGGALEGTGRPFVITSGVTVLTPGKLATEDTAPDPKSPSAIRIPSEAAMIALASRGVRTSIVRLPTSVHGDGDHAFVPAMIAAARKHGVSAYVGDGANRWPAVHRLDAVDLYRLALETAPAGSALHGVGDEGVPVRAIAEVIGRRLNVPIRSITADEAKAHFDWLAYFVNVDAPASSTLTQERLGWRPTRPGLLADLDRDAYFTAADLISATQGAS